MLLHITLERDGTNVRITVRDEADDWGCYKSVTESCSETSADLTLARLVLDFVGMPPAPADPAPNTLDLGAPGFVPCATEHPGSGSLLKRVLVNPVSIEEALKEACESDPRPQFLMTYKDATGATTRRIITPSNIEKGAGRWGFTESRHLIAYDVDKGEPRTFRLDRIERLEAL